MKSSAAIVLIGYQNDYFSPEGILNSVIEESAKNAKVIENTLQLIEATKDELLLVSTPIIFSENYDELIDPIGILATIKQVGAFKANSRGSATIDELAPYQKEIQEIPGKQGINAFINTELEEVLRSNGIKDVVLAGCVTSICIDSTARSAFDKGFSVHILSDCISGRSVFENKFYLEQVFPLYANVIDSRSFLSRFVPKHVSYEIRP